MIVKHPQLGSILFNDEPFYSGKLSTAFLSEDRKYLLKIPHNEPRTIGEGHLIKHEREMGSEYIHINNSLYKGTEPLWPALFLNDFSSAIVSEMYKRYKITGNSFRIKSHGIVKLFLSNCILLRYYDARSLDRYDYNLSKGIWYRILKGLLLGLARFPHGDLKPGNILIDNDFKYLHIVDPGIEIAIGKQSMFNSSKIIISTPFYYPIIPPSMHKNRRIDIFPPTSEAFFSEKSDKDESVLHPDTADIIAIGIMFYMGATGRYPFDHHLYQTPLWLFNGDFFGIGKYFDRIEFENPIFPGIRGRLTEILAEMGVIIENIYKCIIPPKEINTSISNQENDFIMNLLRANESLEYYIEESGRVLSKIS